MKVRWWLLLVPPFVISFGILLVTQFVFLRLSFFKDLGLGLVGSQFQISNYLRAFQDPFYLRSLELSVHISITVVVLSLLLSYPVAYTLARMRSKWATVLLAAAVISSFITIVIKVLGLIVIFGADGTLNTVLRSLGILDQPVRIMGTQTGVVVGLMQYTLAFFILILFSVIQTIPRSLEEAAEVHGASRWRVMWRVVLPLSLPGVVGGSLIVFNMSMGAFTSAALLGGGRILTLPVVIQRTVMVDTKYAMGATLSAVLLLAVLLINLLSIVLVTRLQGARTPEPR